MASIEKTDNQRWRERYRDPSGRSRSRTFSTKAAAQRFLNGVGADMQRGQWIDPALGTTKLSTWVEEFLRTAHDLDPSTRATYERDLRRYVLPRFGEVPLCRINKLDIRSWINDELGQGLAASSVHRHFRTLRRVLNVAVEHELLARSPCVGLSGPRVEATEMRFLDAGEVQRVAEELSPQFRTLVYAAAYTGMRWGELIGLRRARVDLGAPAITVVEQLVILDGAWVRKTPKTAAGRRRITLPSFLADLLAIQLDERAGPGPDGLVFPNRAGNPINPSSFNGNHWKPAKTRAGIEGVRFTTSDIPRWPWPSPREPTPRPSRPGWVTPASRSPSTATGICSRSSIRRWPKASTARSAPPYGSSKVASARVPMTQPGHKRHAWDTKSGLLAVTRGPCRSGRKPALTSMNA